MITQKCFAIGQRWRRSVREDLRMVITLRSQHEAACGAQRHFQTFVVRADDSRNVCAWRRAEFFWASSAHDCVARMLRPPCTAVEREGTAIPRSRDSLPTLLLPTPLTDTKECKLRQQPQPSWPIVTWLSTNCVAIRRVQLGGQKMCILGLTSLGDKNRTRPRGQKVFRYGNWAPRQTP